jgi:LmbE family N-acetylglucosaminyl deacetylase
MLTDTKVVIVVAHPDDAESFCGGTIARLTQAGNRVALVVCTSGDRGSHDSSLSPTRLISLRHEEQSVSKTVLGISEIIWLGYDDGKLAYQPELRDRLIRIYRQIQPQVIITFDPWKHYEFHPDHRAVGFAATEARMLSDLPWICPELTLEGTAAWHPKEMYLFAPQEPNYWVDISDTIDIKVEARLAHHSQNDFIHCEADRQKFMEMIRSIARKNGEQCNMNYAESYYKVDGTDLLL